MLSNGMKILAVSLNTSQYNKWHDESDKWYFMYSYDCTNFVSIYDDLGTKGR